MRSRTMLLSLFCMMMPVSSYKNGGDKVVWLCKTVSGVFCFWVCLSLLLWGANITVWSWTLSCLYTNWTVTLTCITSWPVKQSPPPKVAIVQFALTRTPKVSANFAHWNYQSIFQLPTVYRCPYSVFVSVSHGVIAKHPLKWLKHLA